MKNNKYQVTRIDSLNIANDGRRTLIEISSDNRGDTLITFGASYTLRVDIEDLEALMDGLRASFEDHKQRAINEFNKENQTPLPFNDLEDTQDNYPLNDPRKW